MGVLDISKNEKEEGHNVIEGTCPVCLRSITGTDLTLGYAENVSGKWVHIHHLERGRKLLSNEGVMELIEIIRSSHEDILENTKAAKDITIKAKELNLNLIDIEYACKTLLCKNKCSG